MKIGPRYKIARRLGADIFPKTQSPKFALRTGKVMVKGYGRSEFGAQLKEKQRARFFYGLGERQFARYVSNAIAKKNLRDDEALYLELETRLDNVIYRLGIAPSRQASRQYVSHGHFMVNGVRVTIPSYRVKTGDVIRLRKASESKPLFLNLKDTIRDHQNPTWLRFDLQKGEATVVGTPKLVRTELPFNIGAILEFYRR
ncbi:MAG: 30S ribosomal protein S4 [Candidatus Taylorbacteria bacterium]|nr:30S ribosomal protein S4 [Candidatus Taylorbacteria bacterium]